MHACIYLYIKINYIIININIVKKFHAFTSQTYILLYDVIVFQGWKEASVGEGISIDLLGDKKKFCRYYLYKGPYLYQVHHKNFGVIL